jgi:hypothetical protein
MPNKVYYAPETAFTFADSGGDAVITLASLASGGGRLSASFDRGTGSKPGRHRWELNYRANAAPTVSSVNVVRLYLLTSVDNTKWTSGLSPADGALTPETLAGNSDFLGAAEITEASTSRDFNRAGFVNIMARYVAIVVWNACGQALHATAANNYVKFTPVPDEIQ